MEYLYRKQFDRAFLDFSRFVPIVCTAVWLVVGIIMFYGRPVVQQGIAGVHRCEYTAANLYHNPFA